MVEAALLQGLPEATLLHMGLLGAPALLQGLLGAMALLQGLLGAMALLQGLVRGVPKTETTLAVTTGPMRRLEVLLLIEFY